MCVCVFTLLIIIIGSAAACAFAQTVEWLAVVTPPPIGTPVSASNDAWIDAPKITIASSGLGGLTMFLLS